LPDSGRDLCSQPTVSRWENAPDLRQVMGLTYAMVDLYCASYPRPPRAVTLDTEARYGAWSWRWERRVAARIEATTKGFDIRFVVTNIKGGSAEWLYDTLYCARGQAENLIKLHKSQLASDRTSCRSPLANQVRLVLHTGAFWLMLGLRDAIPKPQSLAQAEFTTLRMRLIKIGARIAETASRVRIAFAAAHPEAALFASLARVHQPAGP
jgi:hypothetical protein